MQLTLSPQEVDALVRSLDGLTDVMPDLHSVVLERRDSLDMPHDDGFLIVAVRQENGDWAEDAISKTGSTSYWGPK